MKDRYSGHGLPRFGVPFLFAATLLMPACSKPEVKVPVLLEFIDPAADPEVFSAWVIPTIKDNRGDQCRHE